MAGTTSTRYAAWTNIRGTLTSISTLEHWFDPTVTTDHPEPDSTLSKPVLVMSMGDEVHTDISVGGRYSSVLTINIDGYVNYDSDYIENSCKLCQDVRRAVTTAAPLIAAAIDGVSKVVLGDQDQETGWLDVDGGHVRFRQPVEIHYRTRSAW